MKKYLYIEGYYWGRNNEIWHGIIHYKKNVEEVYEEMKSANN